MAQPPKKKKGSPSPFAEKHLPLFGPDCAWALLAIVLIAATLVIVFVSFSLPDAVRSELYQFITGRIALAKLPTLSFFPAWLVGGVLGGVVGYVVACALPREKLAEWKFDAQAILLILPVLLLYIPSMTAGFIWDDDQEITANQSLQPVMDRATGLLHTNWRGLWEIWAGTKSADYFPLKTTMLWIEFQLWGIPQQGTLNGYHVMNIVLHGIDAVLVWIVLRRLAIPGAWLAGLVFAIHPVHAESVGWIAERKNTLSTLFYLCAILAYLDFEEKRKRKPFANFFSIAATATGALLLTGALMSAMSAPHMPPAPQQPPRAGSAPYWAAFFTLVPLLAALNFAAGFLARKIGNNYGYLAALLFFVAGLLCKTHVVVVPFVLLVLAWWRHGQVLSFSNPDDGTANSAPASAQTVAAVWLAGVSIVVGSIGFVLAGFGDLKALVWRILWNGYGDIVVDAGWEQTLGSFLFWKCTLAAFLVGGACWFFLRRKKNLVAQKFAASEDRALIIINTIIGMLGVIGGIWAILYLLGLVAHFDAVNHDKNEKIVFMTHMFKKGYLDREFWFLSAICIASGIFGMSCGFFSSRLNRHLIRSIAFFQIAVLLGAITVWFQYGRAIGDEDIPIGALPRRFANAGWAVWWYLFKALVPAHLITIYHKWPITPPGLVDFLPLLGLIWTMVLLYRHRKGWARIPFAVMVYFIVTLLPVMGFLKMSYLRLNVLVADHFQYISDIAVIAALCAGVVWLWKKAEPVWHPAIVGAGVLILSAMAAYTWDRAGIYQGEESLWRDTLSKNPDTWQGHNHIGAVLYTQGTQEDQIARILESQGKTDEANAHRAIARQRFQEATKNFADAVRLKPDNPESHNNLGLGYMVAGREDEALDQYREAVRIKGDEPSMRTNLANALAAMAAKKAAAAQKAAAAGNMDEANREGMAAQKLFDEAISNYREILKMEGQEERNAGVHVNLGVALMQTGHIDEAIEQFKKAVDADKNMPQATANLNAATQLREQMRGIESQLRHKLDSADSDTRNAWLPFVNMAAEFLHRADAANAQAAIATAKVDPKFEPMRQQLLAFFPQMPPPPPQAK